MRARNQRLYAGLSQIPGAKPRRVIDQAGDSGPFVLMTWPSEEICNRLVEMTRAAGVRPGPDGIGNIRMVDWHMHIYYNIVSLVEKQGVNSAGRPWSDPLNEFHKEISYAKGALPQMDDLIGRSCLITVPPALTDGECDRIVEIYQRSAAQLGLK
jgi:8-amino-3,8-dideoxy-alpha-D-manno-octulosonate transaminase